MDKEQMEEQLFNEQEEEYMKQVSHILRTNLGNKIIFVKEIKATVRDMYGNTKEVIIDAKDYVFKQPIKPQTEAPDSDVNEKGEVVGTSLNEEVVDISIDSAPTSKKRTTVVETNEAASSPFYPVENVNGLKNNRNEKSTWTKFREKIIKKIDKK